MGGAKIDGWAQGHVSVEEDDYRLIVNSRLILVFSGFFFCLSGILANCI